MMWCVLSHVAHHLREHVKFRGQSSNLNTSSYSSTPHPEISRMCSDNFYILNFSLHRSQFSLQLSNNHLYPQALHCRDITIPALGNLQTIAQVIHVNRRFTELNLDSLQWNLLHFYSTQILLKSNYIYTSLGVVYTFHLGI